MANNRDLQSISVPAELWRHPDPQGTPMYKFLEHVNSKYNLHVSDYPALYKWSVDNIAAFWEECWYFVGIKAFKSHDVVSSLTSFPSFLVSRCVWVWPTWLLDTGHVVIRGNGSVVETTWQ